MSFARTFARHRAVLSRGTATSNSVYNYPSIRPFTFVPFSRMSDIASGSIPASAPGENFEPRQTAPSEDYKPDPSKSLPLSPARQALVDDIIALYSCQPTVRRVERYTPDCVYDDQFVYANDRYKMAGQWFALPKLFNGSKNEGYQVVVNEKGLIQFKNEQVRNMYLHKIHPNIYGVFVLTA